VNPGRSSDLESEGLMPNRRAVWTAALVGLWSIVSGAAMIITFLPVGLLAGLGQWWILRSRLQLTTGTAIPFALSFPIGQVPSYLIYLVAYTSGFGGYDGPPEWFVGVTLAAGGLFAGLVQFVGLPKSWKNFAIWIPSSTLGWAVAALGDLGIRGMLVISAVLSGLVTGLAMLSLSPRPHDPSERFSKRRRQATTPTASAAGLSRKP
jgi:hypothetical protein